MKNAYYHYKTLPDWLYNESSFRYNNGEKIISEKNRATANAKEADAGAQKAHYSQVGDWAAKMAFANARTNKAGVTLVFPFRDDLMPGTTVKIENSDAEDLSFLGATLYGMVSSTSISCNMLGESGTLNTVIRVGAVRNESDNNSDNLTFTETPFYEGDWVGVDLYGNLLSEAPKSDKPSPRGTKTNSTEPGNTGSKQRTTTASPQTETSTKTLTS
jgi:hypothetical protein